MPPTPPTAPPKISLTIHGTALSTSRVLTILLEKSLPYTLIPLNISIGEQHAPEYIALQPFGKVPVLIDRTDGHEVVMYESRAICRYIERKYPTLNKLIPDFDTTDGGKAFAAFEQTCSMEQSYFSAAAEKIGYEVVIKGKVGLGGPDPAVLARVEQELYNTLEIYNSILAKQKYIAGDEMTMADLFHLPTGAALRAGKWKAMFESFEHVERWFGELEKRNSWIGSSQECNIFG